ncbi:MAG: carboxymuconolactone decarboxylase family protein [Alphaproteobacteria bacterium]|jgi:4-carboxymuconolactone decarboxylase|uniref:Carboxymuconolactone decarboxylase n=3 Tax=Roseobacteraceae TaxID=2854170 RepID=K2JSF1_9RHOB|nr:carboxymuconolactone decarboxylase family protein [Celeribacter baekdonensis]MBU0643142.1 carboxymuconolactone decarboxylase family protein [Alphaproteobacteria bacterium]EKE73314.1 carboxymuconolactone decarboxylase [Celeribacter baekdonensis B30]MBU1279939.1 carboxymuconolactone decarboxylase family protein [Alphaproteobacteria bacterium]MBU1572299.1 carboxymuconolactone decarboxylase family protein [Alphaproteobacteria bacterium]MBU1827758.1 carboxymuconolactone decarboxylase family prot|tara:strand:+ start:19301 stop:19708 length:408 start_codon:yes stop_codon:yes gene_type:complete
MNDFTKLFAEMIEQSQKMAASFNPALENFQMPAFDKLFPTMSKEQLEMFWGNAFNKDGLDAKTRLLVVLAGQTVLGAQAEVPFKMTVRHAIQAGATQKEIAEVIYQMSMLGGVPAMSKALELAQAVFSETQEGSE